MRYAKPQHFLPVHGEYAFLCAHAQVRGDGGGGGWGAASPQGRRTAGRVDGGAALVGQVAHPVALQFASVPLTLLRHTL